MRIITGKLKGRKLTVPPDADVRPTSDRAKEGLFNVIEARKYIEHTTVLDLYAGSGNLGFEAISRGAASVLMVDAHSSSIKHIEQTAKRFGVESQIKTRVSTVEDFLAMPSNPFDFIFSDPPYDNPFIPESVDIILNNGWLHKNGWYILEHDVRHLFHEHPNCVFTKPYGRTIVSIFMNPES